jgi:hypothetical protein
MNDEDDEDFVAESGEEDEGEDVNNTDTGDSDDDIDESNLKYFDEKNLEEFFDDHRYTLSKNQRADFHCTLCLMTFKWSMTFIQHMVEKHEKMLQNMKVHQCVLCDKCFLANRDLASHYRLVHKQLDCFACKYCNATFHTGISYNRHLETCQGRIDGVETEELLIFPSSREKKTYGCSICLKVLKTEDGLTKHMRLHEEDAYLM